MQAKPDFDSMSGAELLAAYNSMAEKPRTSKFETKADAVRKCNALWAQKSGTLKVVATNGPELEPSTEKENYPAPKKREPLKRDLKATQKIEILVEDNPRKEGTGAWEAFEILRKCETWGEYFSHFTTPREKKDAGLRLKHNEKDGYVRIVKAK